MDGKLGVWVLGLPVAGEAGRVLLGVYGLSHDSELGGCGVVSVLGMVGGETGVMGVIGALVLWLGGVELGVSVPPVPVLGAVCALALANKPSARVTRVRLRLCFNMAVPLSLLLEKIYTLFQRIFNCQMALFSSNKGAGSNKLLAKPRQESVRS